MEQLLESSGLHSLYPKPTISTTQEGLCLSNRLRSRRPCRVSFHVRDGSLHLSFNGNRGLLPALNNKPIFFVPKRHSKICARNEGRSLRFGCRRGTKAAIIFFKKKRSQKQSAHVGFVLLTALLCFGAKHNLISDSILNIWSEYSRVVLNTDGGGGDGGGIIFGRGFGGGDGRRKVSKKWWWLICFASVFGVGMVLVWATYQGKMKIPHLDGKRLDDVAQVGSFGLLVLIGVVTMAVSGLLKIFTKKRYGKANYLCPARRSKPNLSLLKIFNAGALFSIVGLGLLTTRQARDDQMRSVMKILISQVIHIHSFCQSKTTRLVKVATTGRYKARRWRKV